MPLLQPFSREKNTMVLTVLLRTGKKYRKIAKGEINFYKKYFLTEKLAVDKWVYLNLYETQLEQMGHNSNIVKAVTNTGKIYMKANLLDPLIEDGLNSLPKAKSIFDSISIYTATTHASAMTQILKSNLKSMLNTKDKIQANKTDRLRSVTEHSNDFLRSLKNRKNVIDEDLYEDIEDEEPKKPKPEEFNDGLSDISISIIDGTEENHVDIEKMNLEIDNLVSKIKVIFDNKIDDILPKDPVELKNFIKSFSGQIDNITENYSQNLLTLSDINKRIKFQAKDYYERYKEMKKTFKKERRDLRNKNKMLEQEYKVNQDDNKKISSIVEDFKGEVNFFKHKVGISDSDLPKDDDLTLLVEVLDSLKNSDVDITTGLDDTQKASLFEILEKYRGKQEEEEAPLETEKIKENGEMPEEPSSENYINDEVIINKIEDIVNENFGKGKIINIKIDQVSEDTFKFNEKNAQLYIENDILKIREKGFNSFEEWVLTHFGTQVADKNSAANHVKKNSTVATNGKTPMQAMLDKKLAEKKAMLGSNISTSTGRNKTPNTKK